MEEHPPCSRCRAIVRGSVGITPHESLISLGTVRDGKITIYRCKDCGLYWEYRADHIQPGWQASFILYDYLLKKKDDKEPGDP